MIQYIEETYKRRRWMMQVIEFVEDRIHSLPEGSIRVKINDGRTYYTYLTKAGEKEIYMKKNSAKDRKLVQAVAQRRYYEKALKEARKEYRHLTRLEEFYQSGSVETVFEKMTPQRQQLIRPIRLTDEQYAAKWQDQNLRKKRPPEEKDAFETIRGELTRSKSEQMMADRYYRRGVPYHYEPEVDLIDHKTGKPYKAHPDFLVLNKRTRKEYYHEHFGRMDDPEYAQEMVDKLIDYMNAGYVLGDNLIATFETKESPLKPDQMERLIEQYLL